MLEVLVNIDVSDVALLEPKRPLPSRAVTPEPAADVESVYALSEMRFHTRTPSLGTEYLFSPPGLQRSFLDMSEGGPEPRSSTPPYDRPSSPSFSRQGTPPASSILGFQPSPTPTSLSFALLSRAGTPTAAAFQRPITPSVAMHRPKTPPLPAIVDRPATPDTFSLLPESRAGPSGTSKALQLEKEQALRSQKQPTFHADSGVRFKDGDALPEDALVASSQAAQAKNKRKRERKDREKKHVSCASGASAISEVPPMYTEE